MAGTDTTEDGVCMWRVQPVPYAGGVTSVRPGTGHTALDQCQAISGKTAFGDM